MQSATYEISFGDCDPAGIVFYPNVFRWMDSTFHAFLRPFGGHASICELVDAVGLGLVDATAQFRHPMRDGEQLEVRVTTLTWSGRSFTVNYEGVVGHTTTFTGKEVRCLFRQADSGIVASDLLPLREVLEP